MKEESIGCFPPNESGFRSLQRCLSTDWPFSEIDFKTFQEGGENGPFRVEAAENIAEVLHQNQPIDLTEKTPRAIKDPYQLNCVEGKYYIESEKEGIESIYLVYQEALLIYAFLVSRTEVVNYNVICMFLFGQPDSRSRRDIIKTVINRINKKISHLGRIESVQDEGYHWSYLHM